MLFPSSDVNHPAAGFELTAICILENLPSFRLDPSPPIAPIVERTTDGFIVESVQLLATAALAKAASQSMSKLQYLALQLAKQGHKRSLPWTHDCSPAMAKKRRVLSTYVGHPPAQNSLTCRQCGAQPLGDCGAVQHESQRFIVER